MRNSEFREFYKNLIRSYHLPLEMRKKLLEKILSSIVSKKKERETNE